MWAYILSLLCFLFGWCEGEDCRQVSVNQTRYSICTYSVSDISVRLFQNDESGTPFGSLSALAQSLSVNDQNPHMLMNGGMYHDDLQPVGLYVEEGRELKAISTSKGWGNFHLLPNGVFWIKGEKLGISESRQFKHSRKSVDYATQSGPMLVIKGRLHPRFLENSDSRKIRNGVGLSRDGATVHFAISHDPVTFWDFGSLFKDELKAHDALFLDGTVSTMRTEKIRRGGWRRIGPIISVTKKKGAG